MEHLRDAFGGIRKMKRLPLWSSSSTRTGAHRSDRARKLEIPIIGTGDTNVDPDELGLHHSGQRRRDPRPSRLLCLLVATASIEGPAANRGAEPRPTRPPKLRSSPRSARLPPRTRRGSGRRAALTFEPRR